MEGFAILAASSVAAGFLGAMMGVGGGIVVVPVLAGILDVPIRLAVGASMIAVVATSCAASASFVRDGLANVRLGLLLALFTAVGSTGGVFAGTLIGDEGLAAVLAGMIVVAAVMMYLRRKEDPVPQGAGGRMEESLRLAGEFTDPAIGGLVRYGTVRVPVSIGLMLGVGFLSGLLGVGGGALQVPVMVSLMRVPIKAATATSSFMMGITAAAGAVAFVALGDVQPAVAGLVAVGVFLGSLAGARVMPRVQDTRLKVIFVVVLAVLAIRTVMQALG